MRHAKPMRPAGGRASAERGFALLTVLIFALIVGIAGLAFFAMVSYENRNALYRQHSSEAFYLADGAIEQARAKLLEDMTWRGPIPVTPLGNGTYNLTATDSTWVDGDDALYLYAEGHVADADRAVEAWVRVRPAAGENFIVMNDMISSHGNLCLNGHVHVNGDADFGSNDVHLKCGGTYTEGFPIYPPPAHTEPEYFPNSTYYYVYADPITKSDVYVYKFDKTLGDTVNVTAQVGDLKATGVFRWDNASSRFVYDFSGKIHSVPGHPYAWKYYFDSHTGKFAMDTAAGDSSVVVNFGDVYGPPYYVSDLFFKQQPGDPPIEATIIDTRFIGASEEDRILSKKWTGGAVRFGGSAAFAPRNCIALVIHDVDFGNARVQLGTPSNPALTYITKDVVKVNGQLAVEGTMIVLHDFFNTGGPDITFNPAFLTCMPPQWSQLFGEGSGIMVVLEWKEIPVKG